MVLDPAPREGRDGDPCTTTIRRPLRKISLASNKGRMDYFVSLCAVCFLHLLQCFFISNLSFNVFLLR
jgi:hypothetical protein